SADAVDAVLVRLKGDGLAATHEVLAERELPLDDELRAEVLAVAAAKTVEPERLMRLDTRLAEVYAEAVRAIAEEASVKLTAICAIGSHGHPARRNGARAHAPARLAAHARRAHRDHRGQRLPQARHRCRR